MTLGQGNFLNHRYRIIEILGRGGMGAVYRAIDESLGVEVAVKENLFTTEDYAAQFRMEAVILAGIRHPNLPRVSDHFVVDDLGQYLVMDYIAGDDLRQHMEKNGPISEDEAIRIGAAACDALAYLHSRKPPILHRDIKLGNLKLADEDRVYLVDFGLAKMAWEHEETMTGARAMTPGYSPPEQYGSARTDARSDTYSLGATLYAAVTGIIPEDSLMRAVDGLPLTPLREHKPEISPRFAAVIEKALEVIPANRYQSAEDFKRALLNQQEPESLTNPGSQLPATQTGSVPKKASLFWRRVGLFFVGLIIVAGTVLLNPLNRVFLLAQIAPTENRAIRATLASSAAKLEIATQVSPPLSSPSPTPTPDTPSTPSLTPIALALEASPTETLQPTQEPPVSTLTPLVSSPPEISYAEINDNVAQIFISNLDGSNLRQLTNDLNGACNFAWSPDGKRLVYVSPCKEKSSQYPQSALYLFDLEKKQATWLPASVTGDFEPAWSPDGTRIAFTSLRDGSPQVYVLSLSDSSVSRLTVPGNNIQSRSAAWSPDGSKIVYTVHRSGLLQIWMMSADGSGKQQLLRPGGSFSDYLPAWSPDGLSVLFSETNADLTAPASLMRLILGKEKAERLPIPLPVVDVDFSPDGLWIAYEYSNTKNQDIYLCRLPDGSPQRLTSSGPTYFDPVWRPGQ